MPSSRLLAVVGVLAAVFALPAPVSQAAPDTHTSPGFSEVAGCISGGKNLLVSIVVDESLSLRSTDPRALRVQGITTAVDSLEQLAASVGESTNIEASMSVFARSYQTLANWRKLNPRAAQQLRTTAARVLPGRDAGDATDYRQALLGAKQDLDHRQSQLGDPHACKLLLWFTDGKLDVDTNDNAALEDICQVGGIADAVRRDGISVAALALFTPGAGVSQQNRDQLRAIAEGRAGGVTCGTTPIPSDSATGVYLPADDPAGLQRLFAGAGALVAGGTEVDSVHCPGTACRNGAYQLDIDPGLAGARLLIHGSDVNRIELTSPGGSTFQLSSGESRNVEDAQVSYLVRGQLATLNVTYAPYSKARGRWVVRTGNQSDLSTYWFWGAGLSLVTSELHAGATNEVTVRVVDRDGSPLPLGAYQNPRAVLTVGRRHVDVAVNDDGTIRGSFNLGVHNLPASLAVAAELAVRSAPGGVQLGPITLAERLPIALPPAYPSVAPNKLDFGELEGVGTATAALHVTGSQLGSTRVCLTDSAVRLPGAQPRSNLLATKSECIALNADQTKTLPLTLSPDVSADGVATGQATLHMSAADGSEPVELTVPLQLEMHRPVNEGKRWALIGALLLAAVLVPTLLMLGGNVLLARFFMKSTSRTATKSVRVTRTGLTPSDGDRLLDTEDLRYGTYSGVRKGSNLNLDGTDIALTARRIFGFKEPEGVAVGPTGQRLVSSMAPYQRDAVNEAPTNFGEVDAAFVVVHPADATAEEARGTVILAVPGNIERQGIRDRVSKLNDAVDWSMVLAQVAEDRRRAEHQPISEQPIDPTAEGPAEDPPVLPWGDGQEQPLSTNTPVRRRGRERPEGKSPTSPSNRPDDDSPPSLPDF